MPCNSDYMEPVHREREFSRVLCLLEEIDTGKPVDTNSNSWKGFHPRAYNQSFGKDVLDGSVAFLCDILSRTRDVSKYSLEMQTWWRDHKAADAARLAQERADATRESIRRKALAKLTEEEREVLGL